MSKSNCSTEWAFFYPFTLLSELAVSNSTSFFSPLSTSHHVRVLTFLPFLGLPPPCVVFYGSSVWLLPSYQASDSSTVLNSNSSSDSAFWSLPLLSLFLSLKCGMSRCPNQARPRNAVTCPSQEFGEDIVCLSICQFVGTYKSFTSPERTCSQKK